MAPNTTGSLCSSSSLNIPPPLRCPPPLLRPILSQSIGHLCCCSSQAIRHLFQCPDCFKAVGFPLLASCRTPSSPFSPQTYCWTPTASCLQQCPTEISALDHLHWFLALYSAVSHPCQNHSEAPVTCHCWHPVRPPFDCLCWPTTRPPM